MGRTPSQDSTTFQRALETIQSSRDLDEVRAAQAYLLPLQDIPREEIERIIGRDRFWISKARNRFARGLPPTKSRRGGRHNELLPVEEELEIVKSAFIKADGCRQWGDRPAIREHLRELLDERLSRQVSEATLSAMLLRTLNRYVPQADLTHLWRMEHPLTLLFLAERSSRIR